MLKEWYLVRKVQQTTSRVKNCSFEYFLTSHITNSSRQLIFKFKIKTMSNTEKIAHLLITQYYTAFDTQREDLTILYVIEFKNIHFILMTFLYRHQKVQ